MRTIKISLLILISISLFSCEEGHIEPRLSQLSVESKTYQFNLISDVKQSASVEWTAYEQEHNYELDNEFGYSSLFSVTRDIGLSVTITCDDCVMTMEIHPRGDTENIIHSEVIRGSGTLIWNDGI